MQYENFTDFDAFARAQGTTTIDATEDPMAANQALAGIFDAGAAPEPPSPSSTLCQLPVGIEVDGEVRNVAQVRELNGEDEEELARVGANPFRYFDTLLRRGTVEIDTCRATDRLLRSATLADRDTLVLAVRIATYGPEYRWDGWICPECGERTDLVFDLRTVEVAAPPRGEREYDVALRGDRVAWVRLPNGEDQAALFADESLTVAQQNSIMIGRCVLRITEPDGSVVQGNPDLGRQLGMADRKLLITAMAKHTYGPRLDAIELVHEDCGKEVQVALPLGALFR
jgi:hypothetical protein